MFQQESLTEQQKGVLEDIFFSKLTIQEILERRQIDRYVYCQWFTDELFAIEYNKTLALLHLESKLVFARYTSKIAEKMISLAMEEDEKIALEACRDVINHPDFKDEEPVKIEHWAGSHNGDLPEMSDELASKLLDVVANHQDSKESKEGH
jgi:hypothetical protein